VFDRQSEGGKNQHAEPKLGRRGLIAGLAGLAAGGLLKVAGGTKHAEAAPSALLFPAASPDGPTTNTAYATTNMTAGTSFVGSLLYLSTTSATGGGSYDALHATAHGPSGWGVVATGGTGFGSTSYGVRVQGGTSTDSDGAPGVRSDGGQGATGKRGGIGLYGLGGSGGSGSTQGIGVQGTSTNNKGVYGVSTSSDGVHGSSTSGVGLRGTSSGFVGLVGISDQSIGLYGYTVAPNVPAFYAENLGATGRIAGRFNGDVQVIGNFTVTGGAKNAAVPMPDGSEAVMYCQESPEPYFEDFGRTRLVNGQAHVQIEPEFASTIKRDDYMVFLTPEGESKGWLFVAEKNANGFGVREANGGKSDLPFTYRIIGKRRDIPGKRLERVDPKVKQNIATMKSQAASKQPRSLNALGTQPIETPIVPMEPLPEIPPEAPKKR
jgi:hypothetical protein